MLNVGDTIQKPNFVGPKFFVVQVEPVILGYYLEFYFGDDWFSLYEWDGPYQIIN